MDLPDYIIIFFIFILGAAFGSFLNVVIYRVPEKNEFDQTGIPLRIL